MLIAIAGKLLPRLAVVKAVPDSPNLMSEVNVVWMQQAHKSKWHRYFRPSSITGKIAYREILLYDFELTERGALKKKSREYIQEYF